MPDNLTTQSGTPATIASGKIIATDEVLVGADLVHFQKVKLVSGVDGAVDLIAGDATNGLDVDVTRVQGTVTVGDGGGTLSVDDGGGSLTVDGTVAVTGVATAANQLPNGHNVVVTSAPTTAVTIATMPSTPVTGTFYQATQPVSGAVTSTPTAVTALKSLATSTTVATEVASLSAPTGGLKNYITSIIIANTGATSSSVTFRDGSGGTTILSTIAPALGGSNITLPIPIVQTANTGLYFICGTATSTIYVTVVGYTGV